LIRELILSSPGTGNVTVRQNGNELSDFVINITANKRELYLMEMPVVPGSTVTIINPSNIEIHYEFYYI
jgi:hypothetical protein